MSSTFITTSLRVAVAGALLVPLAACGGSNDSAGDSTSKAAKSSSSSSSAVTDPNAPALPVGEVVEVSGPLDGVATRSAEVAAANGNEMTVSTSPLTEGTLSAVTAKDGKARTAPKGGRLVAVGIAFKEGGLVQPSATGDELAAYTKPYEFSVEAGGKSTKVASMQEKDFYSGKQWIVSVPEGATSFTVSTDGGKQVVSLTDGKRDDKVSNGIAPGTTIPVPVASTQSCDEVPGAKDSLPAGSKMESSVGCDVQWQVVNHFEGQGWAKPGEALLAARIDVDVPSVQVTKAGASYAQFMYGSPDSIVLTGKLGASPLKVKRAGSEPSTSTFYVSAPITAASKPTKVDLNVAWSAKLLYGSDGTQPEKMKYSQATMLEGMDSTNTLVVNKSAAY